MGCTPQGAPNPDFAGVDTLTMTAADGGQAAKNDEACDKQ